MAEGLQEQKSYQLKSEWVDGWYWNDIVRQCIADPSKSRDAPRLCTVQMCDWQWHFRKYAGDSSYVCMIAGSTNWCRNRRRTRLERDWAMIGLATAMIWSHKSSHDNIDTRRRLPAKLCRASNVL